jgi:hypothetical protein
MSASAVFKRTIQLKQNQPTDAQTLANNPLVNIAILGSRNAAFGVREFENVLSRARDLADLWSRYHPSGVSAMF